METINKIISDLVVAWEWALTYLVNQTMISFIALIISVVTLLFSIHFWLRSFRPIVTAVVRTNRAFSNIILYDLEIMNSGSLPARNIRLKADEEDLKNALSDSAEEEDKRRWLSCFESNNTILILQNNRSVKCSFGKTGEKDPFWKYEAEIAITIEYKGWFGKKYQEKQDIQIIDSESFTGYSWGISVRG